MEAEPTNHEAEVCREVTESDVARFVKILQQEQAPGVDGVTSPMLHHAGPQFNSSLTDLVNCILSEGVVPESLLVGKMTLINKKAPSLTVSSALLSVVTNGPNL